MKKILFVLALIPTLVFSQSIKRDSLFIGERFIGKIQKNGTSIVAGVTYHNFTVFLDDFVSKAENEKIYNHFSNISQNLSKKTGGKEAIIIEIEERFQGKTHSQIGGYYLKKAGQLKKQRNEVILWGCLLSSATILFFPAALPVATEVMFVPSATGITLAGIGCLTSGVVAIVKDYQANKMLERAGEEFMKN